MKSAGKSNLVKRSRVRSGPDRLNGRYFDISKPLLHAEVLPQSNTLDPFELVVDPPGSGSTTTGSGFDESH